MNTDDSSSTATENVETRTDHTNCNGVDTSVATVTEVINNEAQDVNVDNHHPQGDPLVSIQINGDAVANSPQRVHHRRHRLDSESIDIQGDSDDDDVSDTANAERVDDEDGENHHLDVPTYNADDNGLEVAASYFNTGGLYVEK